MAKGRPIENDTVIEIYTQTFRDHNGEVFIWDWDKTINSKGPIRVIIIDPVWSTFDKKQHQLELLKIKYESKSNERKPRITKVAKLEMEMLENEINEIWYNNFPEDRPKVRKKRVTKPK